MFLLYREWGVGNREWGQGIRVLIRKYRVLISNEKAKGIEPITVTYQTSPRKAFEEAFRVIEYLFEDFCDPGAISDKIWEELENQLGSEMADPSLYS